MRQLVNTTVITPATSTPPAGPYDLTTLADVKLELAIATGDTTNDAWLQKAITRGSLAIQTYCNMVFATETVQDIIYLQQDPYPYQVPGGVAPLQLSRYPVQSITSVVVNEGVSYNGLITLQPGVDYVADLRPGQLIRLNVWTTFPTNWDSCPTTVIYTAGYTTVPGDLEQAALMWVASQFQSRTRDRNLKSESHPSLGEKTYWIPNAPESHFPPEIAELIDKYRDTTVT